MNNVINLENTTWNAACEDVFPKIPDSSVDAILADLPYAVTANTWDQLIPMDVLWSNYLRIIKDKGAIILFSNEIFSYHLINAAPKNFRYKWYWIKNTGTNFFHAKRMPIRHCEEILIFSKTTPINYYPQITDGHIPTNSGKGRNTGNCYSGSSKVDYEGGVTTRYPRNILEFDKVNNYKRLHPSEKPVKLLEYLIKTYTLEGQLVLDNCAGVFSTGVAALNVGRKYMCIEKNKHYYDLGLSRLNNVEFLK